MGLARWGAETIENMRKQSPDKKAPLNTEGLNNEQLKRVLENMINKHPELKNEVKEALVSERRSSLNNVLTETKTPKPLKELSPEEIDKYLSEFKENFDALPQLHEGIEWADVEKALRADPKSATQLRALDLEGQRMNIFREEHGKFVIASAWDNYEQLNKEHIKICFDAEGEEMAKRRFYKPNGNAVGIIAKTIGVSEKKARHYLADPKRDEQLRKVIEVDGAAWHKTDGATRQICRAIVCDGVGTTQARSVLAHQPIHGSFRVEIRVKKV